jgi:hypothetical protein
VSVWRAPTSRPDRPLTSTKRKKARRRDDVIRRTQEARTQQRSGRLAVRRRPQRSNARGLASMAEAMTSDAPLTATTPAAPSASPPTARC